MIHGLIAIGRLPIAIGSVLVTFQELLHLPIAIARLPIAIAGELPGELPIAISCTGWCGFAALLAAVHTLFKNQGTLAVHILLL